MYAIENPVVKPFKAGSAFRDSKRNRVEVGSSDLGISAICSEISC